MILQKLLVFTIFLIKCIFFKLFEKCYDRLIHRSVVESVGSARSVISLKITEFQETDCIRSRPGHDHSPSTTATEVQYIMLKVRFEVEHTLLHKREECFFCQQERRWRIKLSKVGFIKESSIHLDQNWDPFFSTHYAVPNKMGCWTPILDRLLNIKKWFESSDFHWWLPTNQPGKWKPKCSGLDKNGDTRNSSRS